MAITKLTNIPKQIAKPRKNQTYSASKFVSFINNITNNLSYEDMTGYGYLPFLDVTGVKAAYYDKHAFVQTDMNLSNSGTTGVQNNNRQEIPAQFKQIFIWNMPDADIDANKDYFIQNFTQGSLADKKVEDVVSEAFSQLQPCFDTLYANRLAFGTNKMTTTYGSAAAQSVHYNGLKDLFETAKSDSAVTDVDNIDVLDNVPHRYIDLASSTSWLETFASIKMLAFKMSQLNTAFAFGTDSETVWINKGVEDVKMIIWNGLYEKIKAADYQFYKDLEALTQSGKLVVIQETSMDVEAVNRTASVLGDAMPISINATSLGLARDEIGLFAADGFIGAQYSYGADEKNITKNNITESSLKISVCQVADYLPTSPVAVVKINPNLLSDNVTP